MTEQIKRSDFPDFTSCLDAIGDRLGYDGELPPEPVRRLVVQADLDELATVSEQIAHLALIERHGDGTPLPHGLRLLDGTDVDEAVLLRRSSR